MVVNGVNKQLHADGQIVTIPEPNLIVDTLCDHHLLEKSAYSVNTTKFVHQQFQEFYAATKLRKQLAELCMHEDQEGIRIFQREAINIPVWEEPLNILAEDISDLIVARNKLVPFEVDALMAGQQLVKWAIPIDLFFASKIVRILGKTVWNEVKGELEPLLRKWYESNNQDHRDCALAAILSTGSDDFSDIIWPLLERPDQQVRLSSYRAGGTFNLSSLGSNWKERVCRWEEERRAKFINELSFNGQSYALDIFEDFARNDPSPRIRANAINAIDWCGRRDKMWQVLRESNDETFKVVVLHQFLLRKIPNDLLPRVKAMYQQLLSETNESHKRLEILLRVSDLKGPEYVALLKLEIEKYPIQKRSGLSFSDLRDAVAKIAFCDPEWASEWVVRKQVEGKLCDEHWSVFITKVPNEIIEHVIQELFKSDCQDRRAYDVKYLINKGATKEHAHTIIQKLIEIHCKIKGHYLKDESEIYHRVKIAISAMAWQTLIEAFLEDYSEPENGSLMEVILDLAGLGALERNETQPEISKDTLGKFRILLRSYSKGILAFNDYSGSMKAHLSCALAVFGELNDVNLILELIDADIERIRKGRENKRQNVYTSWSNWHIRALCRLDPNNADNYLLELLEKPEYEEDAGWGLVRLLKRNVPKDKFTWGHEPLKVGILIREREHIDAAKRRQYSSAIEKRIRDFIAERKKEGQLDWAGRSILALASTGEASAVSLILEVVKTPSDYGTWIRIETLVQLIKNGNILDTNEIEPIVYQIITALIKQGIYDNQNISSLSRCLSILACTSDMPKAIAIIKQFVSKYRLGYDMREVIETLGYTGSTEAANYLVELALDVNTCAYLGRELLQALANLNVPESKKAILSIVDSTIQSPRLIFSNKNSEMHIVAKALTNWCRNDAQLKKRIFELCGEKLTKEQREVLADVINRLATTEAVTAGLNIISDQSDNPIPFYLRESVEKSVTEHVPSEDIPSAYSIEPRENIAIRSKLFDMIYDDDARSRSAFNLLGFIGRLRLENGNPPMEPRHPNIERKYPWPPLER